MHCVQGVLSGEADSAPILAETARATESRCATHTAHDELAKKPQIAALQPIRCTRQLTIRHAAGSNDVFSTAVQA